MADTQPELVLQDVTRSFTTPDGKAFKVLDSVSIEVDRGQTVSVIGPSGSGKSTLLNIIGGLDAPDAGSVQVAGVEVPGLDPSALAQYRASTVGFVFQDHHLLPQLSAVENVMMPGLALTGKQNAGDRARKLLASVGLADRADAFPVKLSGGERQRVAVARALINSPRVLLCDEPTGNLDRHSGEMVMSILAELSSTHGVTVLMVTHNVTQAAQFTRCLELRDGHLSPADLEPDGGSR